MRITNLIRAVFAALALLGSGLVWAQAATDVDCDGCIGTGDIATGGVRRADIQNFSVNTSKLSNFAVTTEKIKTGAVTESKIADGAVSGDKISPALADYVNSAIGGLILEQLSLSDGSGVASTSCPSDSLVGSAGCTCNDVNGTRYFGVVFHCAVAGNGGVAGCFPEAGTYNPNLPAPLATITLVCVSGLHLDGTPLQPVPLKANQPVQLSAKKVQTQLGSATINGSGVDLETAVNDAREAIATHGAALQNR